MNTSGKSALVREVARTFNLYVIDFRGTTADPVDLNGYPSKTEDGKKGTYIPFDTFPIEGDTIPEGYSGWLIFLDELPSADYSVQKGMYKLLEDRMVGNHKLHPNVAIIGAGNLETDNGIVNPLGTPMQSRIVHLKLKVSVKEWLELDIGIDYRVLSFIRFKPEVIHKFKPDHDDFTFPCPRTWEKLSNIIKPMSNIIHNKLPLIAGTIGEGMAHEFYGFVEIMQQLPTREQILANPESVPISDEPSIKYAVSGLISHMMDLKTVEQLMLLVDRLPKEFQYICLQDAIKQHPEIFDSNPIKKWISNNSELMSDN